MSESRKIREKVLRLLQGKSVLDIGCGSEKIVSWAVGVDDGREWPKLPAAVNINAPVDPDSKGLNFLHERPEGGYFDVVFSSHTLEHIRAPIRETVHYWLCFVKPGGKLVLYLPDERYYVYDPKVRTARNPTHAHFLTYDTFIWHLQQIPGIIIEEYYQDVGRDRYSFVAVIKRKVA